MPTSAEKEALRELLIEGAVSRVKEALAGLDVEAALHVTRIVMDELWAKLVDEENLPW